jgi:hypothetical protein
MSLTAGIFYDHLNFYYHFTSKFSTIFQSLLTLNYEFQLKMIIRFTQTAFTLLHIFDANNSHVH